MQRESAQQRELGTAQRHLGAAAFEPARLMQAAAEGDKRGIVVGRFAVRAEDALARRSGPDPRQQLARRVEGPR